MTYISFKLFNNTFVYYLKWLLTICKLWQGLVAAMNHFFSKLNIRTILHWFNSWSLTLSHDLTPISAQIVFALSIQFLPNGYTKAINRNYYWNFNANNWLYIPVSWLQPKEVQRLDFFSIKLTWLLKLHHRMSK